MDCYGMDDRAKEGHGVTIVKRKLNRTVPFVSLFTDSRPNENRCRYLDSKIGGRDILSRTSFLTVTSDHSLNGC